MDDSGGSVSQAILNLITKKTTKKDMEAAYEKYPDTQPKGGFEGCNASTVEPIACEIPSGASVLDVGANSGELMRLLKQKGCRVVGVDLSDVAIESAKGKGLRVLKANAEKLPFKDKRFDVVVMREVLTHIHEPAKAIAEARRVLKPEGYLIGSVPHANLERIVWDDKRLHHRYYDEEKLKFELGESFEEIHLKTITGAQFMLQFANSLLGDIPAEMLFKCGEAGLPNWEEALMRDTKTLRVWMGPTQPPGDVYYRLTGYGEKMRKLKDVEIAFDGFSYSDNDSCSEWQRKILQGQDGQVVSSIALHHLDKCLKVANPWVFQLTYYEDIIDFFRVAKEAYPGKRLITETDDWLFDVPSYNIASNPYKPGSEKEKIAFEQLSLSDAIITSTHFLKENLLKIFPDKPIHVIPNSIDFNLWKKTPSDNAIPKKEGVVRISYSGAGNHSGDLEIVKPVLLALLDEFENLEVIMGGQFECFKDVKHPRFIVPGRWVNIIEYPSMIKGWNADIGIAPLRDNNFNRAKSNLRWLEHSALKMPTVASKVRPFSESIKEGSGYLAASQAEWYSKLKDLILDPALRKAIGENAYNDVKENFNMDRVAVQYAELLRSLK